MTKFCIFLHQFFLRMAQKFSLEKKWQTNSTVIYLSVIFAALCNSALTHFLLWTSFTASLILKIFINILKKWLFNLWNGCFVAESELHLCVFWAGAQLVVRGGHQQNHLPRGELFTPFVNCFFEEEKNGQNIESLISFNQKWKEGYLWL